MTKFYFWSDFKYQAEQRKYVLLMILENIIKVQPFFKTPTKI